MLGMEAKVIVTAIKGLKQVMQAVNENVTEVKHVVNEVKQEIGDLARDVSSIKHLLQLREKEREMEEVGALSEYLKDFWNNFILLKLCPGKKFVEGIIEWFKDNK